jgi:hypothetical protein
MLKLLLLVMCTCATSTSSSTANADRSTNAVRTAATAEQLALWPAATAQSQRWRRRRHCMQVNTLYTTAVSTSICRCSSSVAPRVSVRWQQRCRRRRSSSSSCSARRSSDSSCSNDSSSSSSCRYWWRSSRFLLLGREEVVECIGNMSAQCQSA